MGDGAIDLGTMRWPHRHPPRACAGEAIGTMICHPFNDRWIRAVAPVSGTSPLDWFASLYRQSPGDDPSKRRPASAHWRARPPEAVDTVLFLPYLGGEWAPFVAPQASASSTALKASSTVGPHRARRDGGRRLQPAALGSTTALLCGKSHGFANIARPSASKPQSGLMRLRPMRAAVQRKPVTAPAYPSTPTIPPNP